MADVLSLDEIQARIADRRQGEVVAEATAIQQKYRWVKPLASAAEGLIEVIQNAEGRFMLGLPDVDAMTRGFGRGELAYVTGRAHSGKTQILLNAIVNNPSAHVIVFTPDEVAELVLSKLVSIRHNINAEILESRIKAGDQGALELVRRSAQDFRNLLVIDDSLRLQEMTDAVNEAQDFWGERVDAIIYDFLELLPGESDADGVSSKSKALKRWTKHVDAPVLCVHQSAKSIAPRGQSAGMDAMRYGGDTEAIFVLEVFRKRDDVTMDDFDRRRHANTVTVNVAKNKRPPSHTGVVDLYLHPDTGFVRRLEPDDMVTLGVPVSTVEAAYKAAGG